MIGEGGATRASVSDAAVQATAPMPEPTDPPLPAASAAPGPPWAWRWIIRIVLVSWLAVTLVTMWHTIELRGLVAGLAAGDVPDVDRVASLSDRDDALVVLRLAIAVAGWVLLGVWQARTLHLWAARRDAELPGLLGHPLVGWLVPIVNWVAPPRNLARLVRLTGRPLGDDRDPERSGWPLIGTWWAVMLLGFAATVGPPDLDELTSVSELRDDLTNHNIALGVYGVGLSLMIVLIAVIETRARDLDTADEDRAVLTIRHQVGAIVAAVVVGASFAAGVTAASARANAPDGPGWTVTIGPEAGSEVFVTSMPPGTCFDDLRSAGTLARVVDCADPHHYQVMADTTLSTGVGQRYDDERVFRNAYVRCRSTIEDLVGVPVYALGGELMPYYPTRPAFEDGERGVTCVVWLFDPVTAPLELAGLDATEPGARVAAYVLDEGDCYRGAPGDLLVEVSECAMDTWTVLSVDLDRRAGGLPGGQFCAEEVRESGFDPATASWDYVSLDPVIAEFLRDDPVVCVVRSGQSGGA